MTTFTYDGSVIQYDTITVAGFYDVTAGGGQGGSNDLFHQTGGLGASSGGDIFLQAGAVLEIVVGGAGTDIGSTHGAGGGGGSFVVEINNGSSAVNVNEVIAGGGGGAGLIGGGGIGHTAPTGGNGGGTSSGVGGVNGAAGSGGKFGGGGGGFEGGNGGSSSGTGSSGIAGGIDFAGGHGGANGGSSGGFGGGGGGGYSGGGGGGGRGGGGGGGSGGGGFGGGGGSYVNPLAVHVTQSAGVQSGNGFVDITPASNAKTFNYDGSVIQYDTITTTGPYYIVAAGGQGGANTHTGPTGGLAASSGGDIFLQAGAVLEIVVGGAGSDDPFVFGAGGGGGSFVIEINNGSSAVDINEVIAGGGGGAGSAGAGGSGLTAPTGGNGRGFDPGAGGMNGAAGAGGNLGGGGGGGFQGGNGGPMHGTGGSGIAGDTDFAGGNGGANGGANGGFGGGGGGGYSGGAGGGGYGGGGGGSGGSSGSGGGGGGSYVNLSATDITQSAGVHSGNGLVTITQPLCYCRGTRIRTDRGEVLVEDLAIGDVVVTASGGTRPIVWIGTGRVLATRGRRNAATPVIVRKGALADNVPHSDLHVTKGHSLYLDGVLIPVEFLVNHRSIVWDDRAQEVKIYHIELETHDVLIAEGAPAESYRDDGNRWLLQNANSGWDQPPKPPCAPVLTGGNLVDVVWRRLLDRSGPRAPVPITEDPDLHLLVDGRRQDATARDGDALVFALPNRPDAVRIVSRAAVPQELGFARDPRSLGVALWRVIVRQGTRFHVAKADDSRLVHGFHAFEADNNLVWTDGDASLPMALLAEFSAGPVEIVLMVACTTHYIEDGIPEIEAGPEESLAATRDAA